MENFEYRAIIKFLQLQGKSLKRIKSRLDAVYGDAAPSVTMIEAWIADLKRGRTNIFKQECPARSTATNGFQLCAQSEVESQSLNVNIFRKKQTNAEICRRYRERLKERLGTLKGAKANAQNKVDILRRKQQNAERCRRYRKKRKEQLGTPKGQIVSANVQNTTDITPFFNSVFIKQEKEDSLTDENTELIETTVVPTVPVEQKINVGESNDPLVTNNKITQIIRIKRVSKLQNNMVNLKNETDEYILP